MNTSQARKTIRQKLEKEANPERAVGEKKYLKSPMRHYGVSMPKLNSIAKEIVKANAESSIEEFAALTKLLWNSPWHEDRMIAVALLELNKTRLTKKQLPLIEHMITTATGWAQLDGVSVWLVGALIDTDKRTLRKLSLWIKSKNFWVRRTAILAQVMQFRRGAGDFKLFEKLVVPQLSEGKNWGKEERFFIRKAIGWALRELAPHQPKIVAAFVKKYHDRMSGLTFREATRKLPEELKIK